MQPSKDCATRWAILLMPRYSLRHSLGVGIASLDRSTAQMRPGETAIVVAPGERHALSSRLWIADRFCQLHRRRSFSVACARLPSRPHRSWNVADHELIGKQGIQCSIFPRWQISGLHRRYKYLPETDPQPAKLIPFHCHPTSPLEYI